MTIDIKEFTQYLLEGKTVKELQEIFNCSRTSITDFKRKHGLVGLSPNSKKIDRDNGTKTCISCNAVLPLTDFYSNGRTSAGLIKYKPTCKYCENSSRKHSFKNLIFDYLDSQNRKYECSKCSYTGEYGSLDFHHINPNEKRFNIGETNPKGSIDTFIDKVIPELEKCVLLCPNCHRQEHLVMGQKGFDRVSSNILGNSTQIVVKSKSK